MGAVMRTRYDAIQAYTTKDDSIVRELMHPAIHGNHNQSLAEVIVPVGATTLLHRHRQAEEIYHITAGSGEMVLGDERFEIMVGDTVCLMPDTPHRITNTGAVPLKLMCCCSPAYSHGDTELL
jgi:mannose-6-phosphate isomerase-like protein (cupin superfamily)